MMIKEFKKNNITWINIDQVDAEAISYLKKNYKFHHLDIEDIQSESQTPKIDIYKDYLFLVLHFPAWQNFEKQVKTHELNIFLGDGYLITIQNKKSKEIKNFFYRCMNNRNVNKEWFNDDAAYLLYKLIESLFHEARPILNNIGKHVSILENEIFSDEPDTSMIRELAIHRRNILHFRRIIEPQRYLMSNLSNTRKTFLDEHLSLYFDDLRDYMDKLWAIIETYKETISGLHLTVESIINRRTNKVIGTLTVISVALLPLTLLSGIYGMNIEGLPFAHKASYVWTMFIVLLSVILITIGMLKRRNWL